MLGRPVEGIRLLALCYLIDQAHSNPEAVTELRELIVRAEGVGYSSDRVRVLLKEVWASYQADGGRALYREAFGEELSTG
jgi:hypothetical protein